MATSNSGRDNDLHTAEAVSHDGAVDVEDASPGRLTVCAPQQLGGPDVGSTTGADTEGSAVHAAVTLREHSAESYKLDAAMHVDLPGVADAKTRERILAQATARCPLVDESQVTVS